MQAYRIIEFGDIAGLRIVEEPTPEPGPREALVRIHAASLNYRDLMVLNRTYPVPSPSGVTPLSDGAGEVVAIGNEVSRFKIGDRVAGTYFARWLSGRLTPEIAWRQFGSSLDGMLSEYRALDQESLVAIPDHLSFEEASTLPCAALTAWSSVNGHRPIKPGEDVLVVGGGGVAMFAIQFAAAFGARVIAITSKPEKAGLLRGLGADEVVVSSQTPDWDARVIALTSGRGVDHVVEAVGPATLARSIRAAAFEAEIAFPGVFADAGGFDPRALAGRLVTLRRIAVGSREAFEAMNRAIARHKLRPVIDRIHPFPEAPDAYRRFAAMAHAGKVVIAGIGQRI